MQDVLVIVERYPQLSETYIATEAAGIRDAERLAGVIATREANCRLHAHVPYTVIRDENEVVRRCAEFEPAVLHTHYLHMAPLVARVSDHLRRPFTLRTHSYDVLKATLDNLTQMCALLNRSQCLGVLGFPFICEVLRNHGLRQDLLHESWPVIDYQRFLNRSPNSDGVVNLGAALDKKNMRGYIDFAATKPALRFSLYPVGYQTSDLVAYNAALGSPVEIHDPVQPTEMPRVYKSHSWMVYSASLELNTVGWPMAIAEAQASGLGVCFQSKRHDAFTYLGGAGVVFRAFEEIADLVAGPVPEEWRERGFKIAARSDVAAHMRQLEKIWSPTARC